MGPTRRHILAGLAATLAARPAVAEGPQAIGGPALGTYWRCVLPDGASPGRAQGIIEAVLHRIEAALSPWRSDSDVARLNAAPAGAWTPIGPDLRLCLREAEGAHLLTAGGFDARLGPAVRRFGFGPIEGSLSDGQFEAGPDAARKTVAGLTFDPCGLGKGHALDLAVAALARAGLRDVLLEMGGETRALGRHPSGRAWRVALERPGGPRVAAQRVLRPGDLALATSGHAPNGLLAPTPLSHVIDPRSGRPADHRLAQVSVVARTAARADALATGLLALGPEAGPESARASDIAALFLIRRDDGFDEVVTGGLSDLFVS